MRRTESINRRVGRKSSLLSRDRAMIERCHTLGQLGGIFDAHYHDTGSAILSSAWEVLTERTKELACFGPMSDALVTQRESAFRAYSQIALSGSPFMSNAIAEIEELGGAEAAAALTALFFSYERVYFSEPARPSDRMILVDRFGRRHVRRGINLSKRRLHQAKARFLRGKFNSLRRQRRKMQLLVITSLEVLAHRGLSQARYGLGQIADASRGNLRGAAAVQALVRLDGEKECARVIEGLARSRRLGSAYEYAGSLAEIVLHPERGCLSLMHDPRTAIENAVSDALVNDRLSFGSGREAAVRLLGGFDSESASALCQAISKTDASKRVRTAAIEVQGQNLSLDVETLAKQLLGSKSTARKAYVRAISFRGLDAVLSMLTWASKTAGSRAAIPFLRVLSTIGATLLRVNFPQRSLQRLCYRHYPELDREMLRFRELLTHLLQAKEKEALFLLLRQLVFDAARCISRGNSRELRPNVVTEDVVPSRIEYMLRAMSREQQENVAAALIAALGTSLKEL